MATLKEIQAGAEVARKEAKANGTDTIEAVKAYLTPHKKEDLQPLYDQVFKKGKKKFSSEFLAKRLSEEFFCKGDKLGL